jgi:hypothetical protein
MGSKMSADFDPFDGYRIAPRTFWFDGKGLQAVYTWGQSLDSNKYETKISKWLHGTGTTERDSIRIIGTDLQSNKFDLNISNDEDAAEDWERSKANMNALGRDASVEGTKISRRHDLVQKHCDEKAPTAFLGYAEADSEIGITAHWWCQIRVPIFVLEQLESDVSSGVADKVSVGVEWIVGLVFDEHAPLAAQNTWGITRAIHGDSAETMLGYVNSIRWEVSKNNSSKDTLTATAQPAVPAYMQDSSVKDFGILSNAIFALTQRVNIAFTIVAIVIAFAYILR